MSLEDNAIASSSKRKHHSPTKSASKKHKSADTSKPRKRKHHAEAQHDTGDNEKKGKEKSKGKSPFQHSLSTMRLSVAPKFSGDFTVGVKEKLNNMIMRYVPQLEGVLLAHWNHSFVDTTVKIINECPFGVCEVEFESVVWAPKLGQRLFESNPNGTHSLSSPSHLSLLFNKTFNISIPLQHIPQDKYYFEPSDSVEESSDDSDSEVESIEVGEVEVGRWKEKGSGKLVGEGGKGIKFTVIGLEVTNQMLSLTGSLLADPTNPPPPPSPVRPIRQITPEDKDDVDMVESHAIPAYDSSLQPVPAHAAEHEVVDERFLSARELKQKRKEEERRKRDARKVRKEGRELEEVAELGAAQMVNMHGDGTADAPKRKAEGGEREGGKKKRRPSQV